MYIEIYYLERDSVFGKNQRKVVFVQKDRYEERIGLSTKKLAKSCLYVDRGQCGEREREN